MNWCENKTNSKHTPLNFDAKLHLISLYVSGYESENLLEKTPMKVGVFFFVELTLDKTNSLCYTIFTFASKLQCKTTCGV